MNIAIVEVTERGLANKERLHLSVLKNTNLEFFIVFDTTKSNNGLYTRAENVFWFTSQPVLAGDHVILYTGPGKNSQNMREDGRHNYFFYWGLPNTIWTNRERVAVLFEVQGWETSTS